MANKLGDALARLGIPQPDDTLRAAIGQDVVGRPESVYAALLDDLLPVNIDLERLAGAGEIPEVQAAVEPTRGDPVGGLAWGGDALGVVTVLADSDGLLDVAGQGAPYLDLEVGRGRDQGGVLLGEGDVVDPVRMGLSLGAETSDRPRATVRGLGKGVDDG